MHKKIDRLRIHQILWERSDRLNRITLHQRDFAKEMDITHFTVSRLVAELLDSGALKKIGSTTKNVGVYSVREPSQKL